MAEDAFTKENQSYMRLLDFKNPEDAYHQIKSMASDLSDDEHLIRSCIFDLHAAVEFELRRIYYHVFEAMLFLTEDEAANAKTKTSFEKMIRRLGFMDMYRVLRPVLNSWLYPELENIGAINETRNQAAHGGEVSNILYKGRNPFLDADCFSQMYFDVWAIKTNGVKRFFGWTITRPREKLRKYYEKYGDI